MSDEVMNILNEQSRALGRLEANLEKLVGNGQPGLIKEMRDDIDDLKISRSRATGYMAGAIAVFEFGIHFFGKKLGLK